jgi:hypothetical protein
MTRALPEYTPYDDGLDELPPRPRTRLLTPLTVTLALVLFAAGGFVGGVLVEKGEGSGSSTGSLASALAGRGGAAAASTSRGSRTGGSAGRFASLFGGGGTGSSGTAGTVANISGDKVFITTAAGGTVEVVVPSVAKLTKSQSVGRSSIHPGDTVVVTGITASNGTVTASAISDAGAGGASAGLGGFASLFGGGASPSSSSSSSSSSGSGVSLFGGG